MTPEPTLTPAVEADTAVITDHVQQLFVSMGFTAASIRCQHLPPHLYLHIEAGPEGKLLIGTHGAHLIALQHIIRGLLRAHVPAGTRIIVDVNGYRARREQDLVDVASEAAERAVRQGQAVTLPPMNSADRRVIHTALANRTDVKTASLGEEPHRVVVVKPVSL